MVTNILLFTKVLVDIFLVMWFSVSFIALSWAFFLAMCNNYCNFAL